MITKFNLFENNSDDLRTKLKTYLCAYVEGSDIKTNIINKIKSIVHMCGEYVNLYEYDDVVITHEGKIASVSNLETDIIVCFLPLKNIKYEDLSIEQLIKIEDSLYIQIEDNVLTYATLEIAQYYDEEDDWTDIFQYLDCADWTVTNYENKTFWDYLTSERKEIVKEKFPKKYKEFMNNQRKKEFNL